MRHPPISTLFPYTTLFRSHLDTVDVEYRERQADHLAHVDVVDVDRGRALLVVGEVVRSEEHTSELQSHSDLVCRLLLEKKNCVHRCSVSYVSHQRSSGSDV